jgi:hypothetical protein
LNALAKFDHHDEALCAKLCAEAVSKADTFNSQEIANTLNAVGKFRCADKALCVRLSEEAMCKMASFNSQEIAVT